MANIIQFPTVNSLVCEMKKKYQIIFHRKKKIIIILENIKFSSIQSASIGQVLLDWSMMCQ